jgi:hypothetical protein
MMSTRQGNGKMENKIVTHMVTYIDAFDKYVAMPIPILYMVVFITALVPLQEC